jgi:hypothetical protein
MLLSPPASFTSHPLRTRASNALLAILRCSEQPQFRHRSPPPLREHTCGSNRRWRSSKRAHPQAFRSRATVTCARGRDSPSSLTTPSTFVWSLAADKIGHVFAGTGSPATVLRLGEKPGDKPFTLFESRDLSIQALRFGPDGSLYAATVPGWQGLQAQPRRH